MPDAPKPEPAKSTKPSPTRRTAVPVITQNRLFTLLILIVTGSFVFSLLGLGALAFFADEPPTTMQIKFADVCVYICMVTIGALVGLLGGRAAAPDRFEIGERK